MRPRKHTIRFGRDDSVMLAGSNGAQALYDTLKRDNVPSDLWFACSVVSFLLFFKATARETGLSKEKFMRIIDETWEAF